MKKLKHFGLNTLIMWATIIIGLVVCGFIPLGDESTTFGIFFMMFTWSLLYFSTYIIGFNNKSGFLTVIGTVVTCLAVGIAVLGCLITVIDYCSNFAYDVEHNNYVVNPFLNAFAVMWPFVTLFTAFAYCLIQEERDYERGILLIPPVSLVVGYVVALALSFLGLISDFFYTWFFLILMGVIIVLLIVFRKRLPDRLPFLALLCKDWRKGKKSGGSYSYSAPSSTSARPTSSSSAPSARSIVSGLGSSSSSSSSSSSRPTTSYGSSSGSSTSSRPTTSSSSSSSSASSGSSIKKPQSSGSSGNNLGGNIGKLK